MADRSLITMERRPAHDGTGTARPAAQTSDRSLGELVKELAREGSTLVKQEVELARTEMREKVNVYERNVAAIAIGGALLLGALLVLVAAMNRGLTVLFEGWVGLETAVWLAPIVLAVVLALVGWSAVHKGISAIRREGIAPHDTIDSLKQDRKWVERKVQS